MDPVTHLASGALLGRYSKMKTGLKSAVVVSVTAAMIPDIDNFYRTDAEGYLLYHRGVTHSFIGGAVIAFLIALVWYVAVKKKIKLKHAFLWAYSGILMHIYLDYITSYGTMIFAPFSNMRATLESVFIIDPFYTLTMLALLLTGLFLKKGAYRKTALAGVLFIFVYPMFNYGVKISYEAYLNHKYDKYGEITLSTDAFTPVYWKIVGDDGENYHVSPFNVFRPSTVSFETHKKADRQNLREIGKTESMAATYEWFSLYPAEVRDGESLTVYDLRFKILSPPVQNLAEKRGLPFTLKVVTDKSGDVKNVIFDGPGDKN